MGVIWTISSGFPTSSFKNCPQLSNSLWAFPSSFPIPFQRCQAAVQLHSRAFLSSYWLKLSNFYIVLEAGFYISSGTDLFNSLTLSQSQSHATVPLFVTHFSYENFKYICSNAAPAVKFSIRKRLA
jgi:hypothetical protein